MKRGIFRIIAGSIMISLQLLLIIALNSADYYTNAGYNSGFYTVGIVGIVLFIFGINAYKKGLRSQLVLHTKSRKFHTVFKWVMFVVTSLLCVNCLITFIHSIRYFDSFNIRTLMILFAILSFAVYLLFYIYKKPSCLPSASLIFMGIAYLYDISGDMTYYMFYVSEYDFGTLMVVFKTIPTLIAGILYIVLASKLYNENFSVTAVKIIAWITFAMEISNCIVYPILFSIYLDVGIYTLDNILYASFVLGLLLYLCAFKINTLKQRKVYDTADMVRFCRKCGNQLINDSQFCDQCGTQIIKE